MRKVGHKIDAEALRESFEFEEKSFRKSAKEEESARSARDANFYLRWANTGRDYARLGYLFDMPVSEIRKILAAAIRHFQNAIEFGGALIPGSAPTSLAAALLSGDDALAKWLARLPKKSYTHPDVQGAPANFAWMAAMQALTIAKNKNAAEKVAQFQALLTPDKVNKPKEMLPRLLPIAQMLQAVAETDQAAFDNAWKERIRYWKKTYSKASEVANYDGILDLDVLGIAVLARREGLNIPDDNPYAPPEMLPRSA